jgi:hypothetical protein
MADEELPPNVRKLLKRFSNGLDKAEQNPDRLRLMSGLPSEELRAKMCSLGAKQELDILLAR